MTFAEYSTITKKYLDDILVMAEKKGIQYANSKDRLDNFKRIAKNTGSTPEHVALIYATKHWDALNWEIKNAAFKDVDEHVADIINYLLLLRAIIFEEVHQDEYEYQETQRG